jgi:4'-phosphopantetheinyl transferase
MQREARWGKILIFQMQPQIPIIPTVTPSWQPSPQTLELLPGEVHVWRARLNQEQIEISEFCPLLTEEEQLRASQFRSPDDSKRFVLSRVMLRDVLLRYPAIAKDHPPVLCTGPKGKPHLQRVPGGLNLEFNLSHSHSLLMLAITRDRRIGIDVEHLSRIPGYETIAARYFSPSEYRALLSVPQEERNNAFLSIWTRKEAYIKARGDGLSISLDSFTVLPSADGTLHLNDSRTAAVTWSFTDLQLDAHYLGALAVEECCSRFLFWNWVIHSQPPASTPRRFLNSFNGILIQNLHGE